MNPIVTACRKPPPASSVVIEQAHGRRYYLRSSSWLTLTPITNFGMSFPSTGDRRRWLLAGLGRQAFPKRLLESAQPGAGPRLEEVALSLITAAVEFGCVRGV